MIKTTGLLEIKTLIFSFQLLHRPLPQTDKRRDLQHDSLCSPLLSYLQVFEERHERPPRSFVHQETTTAVLLHDSGPGLWYAVPHLSGLEGWGEERGCEAGVD